MFVNSKLVEPAVAINTERKWCLKEVKYISKLYCIPFQASKMKDSVKTQQNLIILGKRMETHHRDTSSIPAGWTENVQNPQWASGRILWQTLLLEGSLPKMTAHSISSLYLYRIRRSRKAGTENEWESLTVKVSVLIATGQLEQAHT